MTFGEFYDIIKNKAVEKLFSPSSAITELLPQNNREGSIVNINEMTVLICDDSMFARKKLSMSISGFGVKAVYEAADGEEAVSKYKEFKPDVVFMDIIMPKVTGIEALKQIIAEDPDAKVIMASSVGTQSHLKDALKSGAVDFLQKPIADNDALKVLENVAKGVLLRSFLEATSLIISFVPLRILLRLSRLKSIQDFALAFLL